MQKKQILGLFLVTLLLIDCTSAGLLQNIREAGFLKDMESLTEDPSQNPNRDSRALRDFSQENEAVGVPHVPNPDQPSFFDQYYSKPSSSPQPQQKPCFPGDFLCLAQRNMKFTIGSEMSNAIVKSVATLMTEMLNSTVARSLDMMGHATSTNSEAEARAAVNMVGSALQTVSSKVIQGFASFLKVSMSGAMRDLLHTVVNAAARSGSNGVGSRGLSNGNRTPGTPTKEQKIGDSLSADSASVNPSSPGISSNEIRRSSSVDVSSA